MMPQQACKLASSMKTMHQQARNNHITTPLNPAAKPFLPFRRNHYSMPSSLPSYNMVAPPLLHPNVYQPYIQYCYMQPWLVQPQSQCYATNFYDPSSFVTPQLSGYVAPCFVPNTGCHSSTSKDPLSAEILKQIEYYFSDENLKHDRYLISKMDDKGWVPISNIANFHRVKAMSTSIPFILDSLVDSSTLEVEGNKIRRREEWPKWISSSTITKQTNKVSPVEKQPELEIVPQETISIENTNASGVSSEKIMTPILTTLAAPGGEESAKELALNDSVNEIVTNESSELVLEEQTEAGADCTEIINAAKSIPTAPIITAAPTNQRSQVEILPPSPPSRHNTVKEEGQLESSSSPKYSKKAQLTRPLLDVEFVRAYLAKGDEVFDDDRFSEFRPQTQKKKRKELGAAKSSHITFSSSYISRGRSHTMKFNLQFVYV